MRALFPTTVFAVSILATPAAQAQVLYDLTVLEGMNTPDGWRHARGLSEDGRTVFGQVRLAISGRGAKNFPRAVAWRDGELDALPRLPGAQGLNGGPTGMNDAGTIVGSMHYSQDQQFYFDTHAVLWQGGGIVDLGVLQPGDPYSEAAAINNSDVIVGTSGWFFSLFGPRHAFRWEAGVMQALPGLPGAPESDAMDINDAGVIVGSCGDYSSFFQPTAAAVYWDAGGVVELPTPPGATAARASHINEQRVIVGTAGTAQPFLFDYLFAPVQWSAAGDPEWLPLLPGDNFGWVHDINEDGIVVGSSGLADLTLGFILEMPTPVLWIEGQVVDLCTAVNGPPGWGFDPDQFEGAYGINDAGQLVGSGNLNGRSAAFLATPVP